MRAGPVFAFVAAFALGSGAQAVEFSLPDLDILVDDAVVYDLDVMYADLEIMDLGITGKGAVRHRVWSYFDGTEKVQKHMYTAVVGVVIPAKAPGFDSLEAALNADVRIVLKNEGVPYAECLLAVQPITTPWLVTYELKLLGKDEVVKPINGICDVDLRNSGIQVGIPQMNRLDLIRGFNRLDTLVDYELMEGLCY